MKSYRSIFILSLLFAFGLQAFSQKKEQAKTPEKPKLVIGIVVDQMRWDYLYRYSEKYSNDGFKKLLGEGFTCANTHINYLPTYTACGHSCVYTGSVPAIHGIAGNAWYDREKHKEVTSVEDTAYTLVGKGGLKGNVSPRSLLSTTITDELLLANNYQSKVVSLALKDRSSVLPGGHNPTGVYFVDVSSGNFITTTYYKKELPAWVNTFNDKKLSEKYLSGTWNTVLPIDQYTESTPDDESYEGTFKGETKPVFPHNLAELAKTNGDLLATTPWGNTITLDFARAAIEGENLGKGKYTDFLALSLSSTDLVGHRFGPNSVEIEDCYLRLDKDLGSFLSYLDEKIGKGNYLVFLTADHGASHSAGYNKDKNMPSGFFSIDTVTTLLNAHLSSTFGEGEWILSHENMQFYLNNDLLRDAEVSREEVFDVVRSFMLNYSAVANVVDLKNINATTLPENVKMMLSNGYNVKRSGDFQILYNPAWYEGFNKGTTHGTLFAYDTHIPLLWYGWNVKHGEDNSDVHMTDIAPTVAAMLHIQEPSGNIGKVISKVFEK